MLPNIRQLECFRALMLHGTMTKAAELLNMSQPGISVMIAGLERATGLTLFLRRGGRLQPTPEAKLFFQEAERALEAIDNVGRVADEIKTGRRGHLAIAAYASISISLLPRVLSLFAQTRPQLQLKVITRNSRSVRELMATQQFDLAIAELPLDYPTSSMEVFSYECLCMLPKSHPLAERSEITPADLDGVPFVTLFRGDPLHQQIAAAFSGYGANWNVVAETEFFSTASEFVAAGCGVGIIDPVVSQAFTANVVLRRFRPVISYQIAILTPTYEEVSTVGKEFIALLRKHLMPSGAMAPDALG